MKRLLVVLMAQLLLAPALLAATNLQLNGLANYQEFKRSIYLAGLYLEGTSADAGAVIDGSQGKRMVLKVTADRWSPRRFSRQWNKGLLINNEQAQLEDASEAIILFNNLLQDDLVQGDNLVIDRLSKGGAEISVNGVGLLTVKEKGFFEMLLRVWIGPRPPSTGFKDALLAGSPDPELAPIFAELKPQSKRIAVAKSWAAGEESAESEPAAAPVAAKKEPKVEKKSEPKVAKVETKPAPKPKAAPKPKPVKVAKEEAPKPAPKPEPKKVAKVEAPKPAPKPEPKKVAKVEAPKPAPKPAPVAEVAAPAASALTQKLAALSQVSAEAASEQAAASEAEMLKEEQEQLISLYSAMVSKRLRRAGASYFVNGLRRQYKKSDTVLVTMNRDGNVIQVRKQGGDTTEEINDMAKRSVEQRGPYPAVPSSLDGDTVVVAVPGKYLLR